MVGAHLLKIAPSWQLKMTNSVYVDLLPYPTRDEYSQMLPNGGYPVLVAWPLPGKEVEKLPALPWTGRILHDGR